jgi:hypothetical protein
MELFYQKDTANKLELKFENGETRVVTGAELHDLIFKKGGDWCITANGTIFRNDIEGIIPGLLTRWYKERQQLQRIRSQFKMVLDGKHTTHHSITNEAPITKSDVYEYRTDDLDSALKSDNTDSITQFCIAWGLTVVDQKIMPNKASLEQWKTAEAYWDKQQLVKKINLNSAYGGILNKFMKFYDKRIGQSTTLSGRMITRHMTAKTNEIICGDYNHDGNCIVYNDTDSVYFSVWPEIKDRVKSGEIEWDADKAISLYDEIGRAVSDTFPKYMFDTFAVPNHRGKYIRSAREIVAETGLFIKKKRYACLVIDKEGSRKDVDGSRGSIKAMGLDLRRSDTPKFVQEFLSSILRNVLEGQSEQEIIGQVKEFRQYCHSLPPWGKGTPKAVNNLSRYIEREEQYIIDRVGGKKVKKPTLPGHVRASKNWNLLREKYHDQHTLPILDGQKVVVCDLKTNADNMKSIAYPIDEVHLPDWFLELPFDDDLMIEKNIDKKLDNLLGVLKWDLKPKQADTSTFGVLFKVPKD